MRSVNLLPEDMRPRRTSGAMAGSSYALLGVLGVLFVMLVGYVLTTNSINSKQTQIAEVEQETEAAQARVAELASYEEFARIKTTRVASVRQLAGQRFDWERMVREIALVLPSNTSLLELNASAAGATATGTAPAAPAPADPAAAAAGGPSLQLKGCAERQPDVATLMVRLRKLYRVVDVQLTESTETAGSASTGEAPGAVASTDSADAGGSCPSDSYQFDMNVTFTPSDFEDVKKLQVPSRLGGGA
jgi:Tfp pilus assembly protein PilN